MEIRILWSIHGWIGGSSCDSYEIFDVHILSDFLKVKLIGVLFRRYVPLTYLGPLIIAKHFYVQHDQLMTHLSKQRLFKQCFGKNNRGSMVGERDQAGSRHFGHFSATKTISCSQLHHSLTEDIISIFAVFSLLRCTCSIVLSCYFLFAYFHVASFFF